MEVVIVRTLRLFSLALLGAVFTLARAQTPDWSLEYITEDFDFHQFRTSATDSEGNIVVGGTRKLDGLSLQLILIKYSPDGDELWKVIQPFKSQALEFYQYRNNNPDAFHLKINRADNSIYLAGTSRPVEGSGYDGLFVSKYSSGGAHVSTVTGRFSNGVTHDSFGEMALDTSGNLVVVGSAVVSNQPRSIVAKYGPTLTTIFSRTYEVDAAALIDVALSGSFIYATGKFNDNFCTRKFNGAGDPVWTKTYASPTDAVDQPSRIIVDWAGNIVVAGGADKKLTLIKYDPSGVVLWTYISPRSNTPGPRWTLDMGLCTTGDLVVGVRPYWDLTVISGKEFYVTRISTAGVHQWTHVYPVTAPPTFWSQNLKLVVDSVNNTYFASQHTVQSVPSVNGNIELSKLDPSGNQVWMDKIETFLCDHIWTLSLDKYGALIAAGSFGKEGAKPVDPGPATLRKYSGVPRASHDYYRMLDPKFTVPAAYGVLSNDINWQGATVQVVTQPSKGTLTMDAATGGFTYQQTSTVGVEDSFTYRFIKFGQPTNTANVTLRFPHSLVSLAVTPTTLQGGGSVTGTVTMNDPAIGTADTIELTTNSTVLTVQPSVLVNLAATTATFPVQTQPVAAPITRQVIASYRSVTRQASVTLNPPVLNRLVLIPTTVYGGAPTGGVVGLTGYAPAAGIPVALSDNTSVIVTPATALVTGGRNAANFTVDTLPVSSSVVRTVTATLGSVVKNASLTLIPGPTMKALVLTPATTYGGLSVTAGVQITLAAPAGGTTVAITDDSSALTTPVQVVVGAGTNTHNFSVGTTSVPAVVVKHVTASLNGSTRTAAITIRPGSGLSALAINPASVKGGLSTTGQVEIAPAANGGGVVVVLGDNTSVITTPASAIVPVGQTKQFFTSATSKVTSTVTRQVTATLNGVTKTANLTLTP